MTNLRTASFTTAELHRFVNCDFNSKFKNRKFKTSENCVLA